MTFEEFAAIVAPLMQFYPRHTMGYLRSLYAVVCEWPAVQWAAVVNHAIRSPHLPEVDPPKAHLFIDLRRNLFPPRSEVEVSLPPPLTAEENARVLDLARKVWRDKWGDDPPEVQTAHELTSAFLQRYTGHWPSQRAGGA